MKVSKTSRTKGTDASYDSIKKNRRSRRTGGCVSAACAAIKESFELATAHRMLQLANRLGLDLADALTRDLENPAHFFERVGVAVAQAIAKLDNLAFAIG